MPDPTPSEMAAQLAEGIAQMREALAPLNEATLGYRRQLEAEGWSPTAAEAMAMQFFEMLMRQMTRSLGS